MVDDLASERDARSDPPPTADAPTVLVVDDEPSNLASIEKIFQRDGMRVKTADGAKTALEVVRSHRVQVVLTDLMMPGISGLELLRAIKQVSPDTEVVMMTAYGTGLRIREVCCLAVGDIDSSRMVIHVRSGKGERDRFVPLPERVLFLLRRYWVNERPKGPRLFPGQGPDQAVSAPTVRRYLHEAAARVFINDAVARVEVAARDALAAMAEGDMLRTLTAALRRFLKVTPVNTVALRRELAAALAERRVYPF